VKKEGAIMINFQFMRNKHFCQFTVLEEPRDLCSNGDIFRPTRAKKGVEIDFINDIIGSWLLGLSWPKEV
jgi:hypothetical protein